MQKGFPYITVNRDKIKNGYCYLLKQRRFLIDPDSYNKEDTPSEYK